MGNWHVYLLVTDDTGKVVQYGTAQGPWPSVLTEIDPLVRDLRADIDTKV